MSATSLTLPPLPVDPSVDHEIQAIVAGASTAETCNTDLAAGPWNFDDRPGYGPGSSMGDVIPIGSPRQGELPAEYREASPEELDARVRAAKETLGDRVMILGHFYQREEVVPPRRLRRRLVPARERRQGAPRGRGDRLLRRALHGRDRRPALAARAGRHPARTSPPAARWPTWPTSTRSRSAGSSSPRSTATWTRRMPMAWCP